MCGAKPPPLHELSRFYMVKFSTFTPNEKNGLSLFCFTHSEDKKKTRNPDALGTGG